MENIEKKTPLNDLMAVSYTHLDVYKRQDDIHSARRAPCDRRGHQRDGHLSQHAEALRRGVRPVSYTHLMCIRDRLSAESIKIMEVN